MLNCYIIKLKTTTSLRKGKHIIDSERQIIEKLYRKHVPVSQIADLLEVHRSTIYRELQRGRVTHLNSELIAFSTYSADRASDERKLRASSHGSSLKIASDRMLVSHLFLQFTCFAEAENAEYRTPPEKGSGGLHSTTVQFIIVAAASFFAEVIVVALQDVAEDFIVLGDE